MLISIFFILLCFPCFPGLLADDLSLLQEYLRIDTSYPDPDYASAIKWLEVQGASLKLEFHSVHLPLKDPNESATVAWLTWVGTEPGLKSVLMYNHLDVVRVDRSTWTVEPFGAEVIGDKIYGRGVQDMKAVAVQQLLAVRDLEAKGFRPMRTLHLGFFPDEERGGVDGVKLFLETAEFTGLNIGFVLDEGMNNEDNLNVYYAQRNPLWLKFFFPGTSAHGSLLVRNTAGEKLQKVLNTLLTLRGQEVLRLQLDPTLTLGDVTSINLNMIDGGIQDNVTPTMLTATFDLRITPHWSMKEVEGFLNKTCSDAGPDVRYELLGGSTMTAGMSTDLTSTSWWWTGVQEGFKGEGLKLVPKIYPAATDGQAFRNRGIPVLGIGTIFKTPNLMHAPNEYLLLDDYSKGTGLYAGLIQSLTCALQPHRESNCSTSSNALSYPSTTEKTNKVENSHTMEGPAHHRINKSSKLEGILTLIIVLASILI